MEKFVDVAVTVVAIAFVAYIFYLFGLSTVIEPLIQKCEQNLPRDQHCKLIAVPVTDKLGE